MDSSRPPRRGISEYEGVKMDPVLLITSELMPVQLLACVRWPVSGQSPDHLVRSSELTILEDSRHSLIFSYTTYGRLSVWYYKYGQ